MGIFFDLVDLEAEYQRMKDDVILINKLDIVYESDKELLERLIYTSSDDKVIPTVPKCGCGFTTGRIMLGILCSRCNTEVKDITDSINTELWVERPDRGPKFILPYVYIVLSKLSLGSINLLDFMFNKNYVPTLRKDQQVFYNILTDILAPEQRNYRYISNNFNAFFSELVSRLRNIKNRKVFFSSIETFYEEFVLKRGHLLFVDHLPIVSRRLLSREKSSKGIYILDETPNMVDAILQLVNIEDTFSEQEIDRRVHMFIENSAMFFYNFTKNMIDGKGGISRKNRCGTRMPFSFRTVVSSITRPHHYLEIHIPWFAAVEVYRPMLFNKLYRQGYGPREIEDIVRTAYYNYSDTINDIFVELIENSPEMGIPILSNRNPSIRAGSIFKLYNTMVKTDLTDTTTSISIQIVTPPNCDFDGDELNFALLVDQYTSKLMEPMKPHYNIMDTFKPNELHGSFTIPKPVCGAMNTFLTSFVESKK